MPHLHGLGFSADGQRLFVPAHTGLRVYENSTWSTPDVPAHDYMGFTVVADGFYSSGHPAPNTTLTNPLGLVKSTNGGSTLQSLGFAGESDFHLLGVGYRSEAIYLLNPSQNTRMQPGSYVSLDRGASWKPFAARGVDSGPYAITVHPDKSGTLAFPTDVGLLQSTDHGANFTLISPLRPVTAAAYSLDGSHMVFGATSLFSLDLASGVVSPLNSPMLDAEDVFTYIATSPTTPATLAVATQKRDIFLSLNNGATWQQIADNGMALAAGSRL
ncbi:MAG TPA: hypothetical protein VFS21_19250 [Roseiflexaceae bacterium]|nr:hypothetical protein [Roseiflexaceae bacterium]